MSGTFIFRAGSVSANSGAGTFKDISGGSATLVANSRPVSAGGMVNDYDYANFFNQPTDAPGTYLLRFDVDTANLYIDGSPIPIGSLAAGFSIATLVVNIQYRTNVNTLFTDIAHNGASCYAQFDQLTESTQLRVAPSINQTVTYNYPNSYISSTSAINNGMGVRATLGLSSYCYIKIWLSGTYNIQNVSWTLDQSTQPLAVGSTVKLTSSGLTALDFRTISTVTLSFNNGAHTVDVPSGNWTFVQQYLFWFIIPSLGGFTPQTLDIFFTGSSFDGSLYVGRMPTIYLTSAPGCYILTPGQSHDILYDTENGGTVNVKIPDPYVRTAFVP